MGSDGTVNPILDVCRCRGTVQTVEGELFAVEIDLVFRGVLIAADNHLLDAPFAEFCGNFIGDVVCRHKVVAVNFHIHGTHASHAAAAFRDVGLFDFRHGVEHGADFIGHVAGGT